HDRGAKCAAIGSADHALGAVPEGSLGEPRKGRKDRRARERIVRDALDVFRAYAVTQPAKPERIGDVLAESCPRVVAGGAPHDGAEHVAARDRMVRERTP